jgi:hypothetical protein
MTGPRAPLLQILRADGTPASGAGPSTGSSRAPRTGEACDLCDVAIGEPHGHLVDLASRSLLCVCRPCYLLFLPEGAGQGRYRAVPERYTALTCADGVQWDLLDIPIGLAFFFHNSAIGRMAALYPSPAGATESTLPLEAWSDVVSATPALSTLAPDVEALLVRRTKGHHEMFIVPIDACYELAGIVRRDWRGFDGGEVAARAIDGFFDRLRHRSQVAVSE